MAKQDSVVDSRNVEARNPTRSTRRITLKGGAVVDVPPFGRAEILWDQEVVDADGCSLNRIGKLTEA